MTSLPGRVDLEAAIAYARAQQHDDPAGSVELFQIAARWAARTGETLLEGEAWLGCGECIGRIEGRERDGLPFLRRAAELVPGTTVAALSWMCAGDLQRFCGEAGAAVEAYSTALAVFAALRDAFGECLARKALADLLLSQGRVDEATPHLVCASSLALDTGEPGMAAELQLVLGERLSGLKRYGEAVSPLRAAAELAQMLGNGQLEVRTRGALLNAIHFAHPDASSAQHAELVRLMELSAANVVAAGDVDAGRAARLMMAALTGGKEKRSAAPEGRARLELATQLLAQGHSDGSFAQYRRAAELYEESRQAQWAGRALLGCAGVLLGSGRAEECLSWFSLAKDQFAACDDEAGLVQAETGRLQALGELQQWDGLDASRHVVEVTEGDQSSQSRAARLVALTYQVQALAARQDRAAAAETAIQAADLAAELQEHELAARLWLGAGQSLHLLKRFPDAADAYEHVVAVARELPDARDVESQALEGLGAVLRDSPQAGVARLGQLAARYSTAGDDRIEALCRYELARCLERCRPAQHAECAAEFTRAAQLFDRLADIRRAGDCWYRAATAYNLLGLLHPEYRLLCYDACGSAAARFETAGDMAGKGLAEFMAGQALRKDDPAAAQDPRNLPALRKSAQSFARAGWTAAESGSRLAVAVELAQVGTDDAWMAAALLALRSYEKARAGILIPYHRSRHDAQIIRGLQLLANYLWQARSRRDDSRRWAELAWRLEQATKGRSFLDQHRQDAVWNSLVSSDRPLRELTSEIEKLRLRRDALTRVIDAALVAGRIDSTTREQADQRDTISTDLEQARRQLDARVEEVLRELPDQAALASVPPITSAQLQACLRPGEAYLGYQWNGGSAIRSLVTPGLFLIQPVGHKFLDYARHAVAAARNGETPSAASPDVAASLLGQIPPGTDTLIVSPDGLLNGLPWHLISVPGRAGAGDYLGDQCSIAVIPAAGILPRLRPGHGDEAVRNDAAYLGVACDGEGAAARLACVDGEVEAIARDYFAADPRSGFLATADCQLLFERGCSVHLLHLACHADRNGLLLSRDGTWVTPVDLTGRGLYAEILLLTGCSAGDFSGHDSNEFLGVVRQLVIATRARAAIVSVAPVPDRAAPVFADLVVSALTGHNPGRPWTVPVQPLAVGPAVSWARRTLRHLSRTDIAPLIPGPDVFIRPWDPRWWTPWFVVGDPKATLDSHPRHNAPARKCED